MIGHEIRLETHPRAFTEIDRFHARLDLTWRGQVRDDTRPSKFSPPD
jgi:hypothetical protein